MTTDTPRHNSAKLQAACEKQSISQVPKHVNVIQDGRIATSEPADVPIHYANEAGLVEEVSRLIDEGYAFVDTPAGWPPSAILQELQARWLLQKDFVAITWSGPGQLRTFVVPHMPETEICPICNGKAKYSTLGHLFALKCGSCGHEEKGTFSPVMKEIASTSPLRAPLLLTITTNGLAPNAANLLAFSRIHSSLSTLTPLELKRLYVSGSEITLTVRNAPDAFKARDAGLNAGFGVVITELG